MKQIKIAENLVHLRRRKGITQETLADFLGISKASVSKWETGQSLPDVAQLPRLAAYYDITIDELMGYEAQLSMKEIKQAYENFAEAFSCQLFSEVMKEVRDFIRQYYSCYPALLQMVVLLMNHFMLAEPSEQSDILEEMVRLCERIQERCTDVNICTNASVFQANIELLRGNPAIAIEKLQQYQDPWGGMEEAEPALIRAYQVAGRMEEAQEWNQVILYRRLLSLVSNSTYYLMSNLDKKELGFNTIERVTKVMDAYDMSHLHPNTYL